MLTLKDVTVRLGGVRVLRNVDLKIEKSSTVALIGANGAGKTTTLRTIMGLTEMTGQIEFDGAVLSKVAPSRRPGLGIGYAAEDRRLFSGFTVEENIKMPGQVAGYSDADLATKMVALGRALVIGSKLIMLDEPFQGLAPALAHKYADALRKLRNSDREVTLIITESNPDLLRKFAERTLVIERGEIREARSHITIG